MVPSPFARFDPIAFVPLAVVVKQDQRIKVKGSTSKTFRGCEQTAGPRATPLLTDKVGTDRCPSRKGTEMPESPLLYPPAEAAKLLGISRARVYTLLESGALQSIHIGRSRRIHRSEIERIAAEGVAA
jgi:excisionase family DNA binding protein